ncbi:MAG: hypothetical protein EKK31_34005 [Hyphomicrobiales bacterium]|nr:MAG: hypothetical protein EKK31_34005 [Hyphomicrobiales bacterium]
MGALISNTLAMMLATIIAVIVWRRFYGLADTNSGRIFSIFISTILAGKIIPRLFNIWRVFLWIGRAVFRPKGTQHLQMAGASLVAFSWISLIVVLALKFAEPVMHFLNVTGISLHV